MAVGDSHPTVITFDLAMYGKVVQLLDSRTYLKRKTDPRLGERHVVWLDNSGIDYAWMEAGMNGPATTRQITKCNHYKRALRAYIYSYMTLYELATR